MASYLPALFLILFASWSGNFASGATAAGSASGHLALLALVAGCAAWWTDPLRLGQRARWLPAVLWAAVSVSCWFSPVPRAGRVGWILLPGFLLMPAVVERCWGDAQDRERGVRAVGLAVALVAGWSLVEVALGSERAAMPLGHHNLLAAWLIALLPLTLLPLRRPGAARWAAVVTVALALAAIIASRSLFAVAAMLAQAAWLGWRWPQPSRRRLLLAVGLVLLLLLGLQLPRLAAILEGRDPSSLARWVYLEGGWRGFMGRPVVGWGPGSVAWTVAGFLRPVPGVNPPGEIVGELHCLPLGLAYELGLSGLLTAGALAAAFVRRRLAERQTSGDRLLLEAGLAGLLGLLVISLGVGAFRVTALPLAMAVVAGATLAASPRSPAGGRRLPVVAYSVLAVTALLPLDWAQYSYEAALRFRIAPSLARERLASALRYDPAFPLYQARLAWLEAQGEQGNAETSRRALHAAQAAPGLAPLWLGAGLAGQQSGETWAGGALERACALDPLGAMASFHRMALNPELPEAPRLGGRAMLAEPRLAAAVFWEGREDLFAGASRIVGGWEGVDPGWREAWRAQANQLLELPASSVRWLALSLDQEPALSFSLHAFRRRPWPTELARVAVRAERLERLTLPAPARLRETARQALDSESCASGD